MFKVIYISISFIRLFLSNKRREEVSALCKAEQDPNIKNLEHRRHSLKLKAN